VRRREEENQNDRGKNKRRADREEERLQ